MGAGIQVCLTCRARIKKFRGRGRGPNININFKLILGYFKYGWERRNYKDDKLYID